MIRNMEEYNFFTKESGRIMFEENDDLVEKNSISDFTELEIKETVMNFKIPKENEEEMPVAVLSGSPYV